MDLQWSSIESNYNETVCVLQKQEKYSVVKLKALHARNEYLLNVEVANAAINKYFSDDVSDLMDVRVIYLCTCATLVMNWNQMDALLYNRLKEHRYCDVF